MIKILFVLALLLPGSPPNVKSEEMPDLQSCYARLIEATDEFYKIAKSENETYKFAASCRIDGDKSTAS